MFISRREHSGAGRLRATIWLAMQCVALPGGCLARNRHSFPQKHFRLARPVLLSSCMAHFRVTFRIGSAKILYTGRVEMHPMAGDHAAGRQQSALYEFLIGLVIDFVEHLAVMSKMQGLR
jgi:hypothetical protein